MVMAEGAEALKEDAACSGSGRAGMEAQVGRSP